MVKVNLKWLETPRLDCGVSQDIWDTLDCKYALLKIPTYDGLDDNKVFCCYLSKDLEYGTVCLPFRTSGLLSMRGAMIDFCDFEALNKEPPILEKIILSLNSKFYDKLVTIPNEMDRRKVLSMKFNIQSKNTVVREGDILSYFLCKVLSTEPTRQGLLDFKKTKCILIRNTEVMENIEVNMYQDPTNRTTKIRCLKNKIPVSLISPKPSEGEDDSIHVFMSSTLLMRYKLSSGSYMRMSNDKFSILVRVFLLFEPNNFDKESIYVKPNIFAKLYENPNVNVEAVYPSEIAFPIATEVYICKIGSWLQSQKAYQELMFQKLKNYFLGARRILSRGQLIPITFNSNFSEFALEDQIFEEGELEQTEDDSLVWFVVGDCHFDEENYAEYKGEYFIDPKKTKLVTSHTVYQSLPLKFENNIFIYYNFSPSFGYDRKVFPLFDNMMKIFETSNKCQSYTAALPFSFLITSNVRKVGKNAMVSYIAKQAGYQFVELDCETIPISHGSQDMVPKFIGYLKGKLENLLLYTGKTVILIKHMELILKKCDPVQDFQQFKQMKTLENDIIEFMREYYAIFPGVIFAFTTNDIDSLPDRFRFNIKFEFTMQPPDEKQRKSILTWFYSTATTQTIGKDYKIRLSDAIDLDWLAMHTAGLSFADLKYVSQLSISKSLQTSQNQAIWDGNIIDVELTDVKYALEKARSEFSASIGAPSIPNVTWDDVGGLGHVKDAIMETIDLPLKHPELFGAGLKKRSGILFYGPPGTGKTLLAKAIATNFSLNFFSVKGPELLNMYIGESEANVRRVFQKARDAKPCVIFFDEVDSVAPKRGNQGDSGGVMDRIVSQLLAELDGMSSDGDGIFIIGATNRPDLLDEALLRPGRFDKLIYLGISDTDEKQVNIMRALTRKFKLNNDVNFADIVKNFPFNYTGADFYALCSDSILKAMTRISKEIDSKVANYNEVNECNVSIRYWFDHIATDSDTDVIVTSEDIMNAHRELVPSVSKQELAHYLRVRDNFESS
ncbi:Peroxisomal ATPase PEX6 [Nakaseomyces bracarensis]|uniref:Peroxisomal ATPase PEX6 n=1 Tax=Nakaseomyces bracarensis TaxID=273131 RepID=A0ABR4NWK6_9SACH